MKYPYHKMRTNTRLGRSPCGERGLKYQKALDLIEGRKCRSPCGERGLKSGRIALLDLEA